VSTPMGEITDVLSKEIIPHPVGFPNEVVEVASHLELPTRKKFSVVPS